MIKTILKTSTPCHCVLRYGISKILVASTLVFISVNAFADTVKCGDKEVGSYITVGNDTYLVVGDGFGKNGIYNDDIRTGIIKGTQKVCTSHVTNMQYLFDGSCIKTINLSIQAIKKTKNWLKVIKNSTTPPNNLKKPKVDYINEMKEERKYISDNVCALVTHSNFKQNINNWDVSSLDRLSQ